MGALVLRLVLFWGFASCVLSKEWIFRVVAQGANCIPTARPLFAGLEIAPSVSNQPGPYVVTLPSDKWFCFVSDLLDENYKQIGTSEDCFHESIYVIPPILETYALHVTTRKVKGKGKLVVVNYRGLIVDWNRFTSEDRFFFKEGTIRKEDSYVWNELSTGVFRHAAGTCSFSIFGDMTKWLLSFIGGEGIGTISGELLSICHLHRKKTESTDFF
eukprot:TRINITY_DN902_c0_g1_i1.p1 TRINITY_DN902_c0_g1~~TRINITY_DN902_c0_g1_i1.p1  ORF type:complete len:222 (-),score=15.88 TRINITY_DN902_c0_g1_i1:58-702(-)